ncbi:ABC transporter ATP-binding protein [Aliivibrio fischeri]|uniref:ABC transporter ATP-binding protein n=1 Tax=Aliivibrio fischeri TaxID=668 RepID=UPI0007C44453|nr:ABC transporter ATP-binding protein [Aliivibrio fischeri]
MIKFAKELLLLLDGKETRRFFIIQVLIIIMAILEMISIMSIGPFLSIITNKDIALNSDVVSYAYLILNSQTWEDFILKTGFIIFLLFLLSMLVSVITTWYMAIFGSRLGASIGSRLYNHYLHNSWSFHLVNSNSYLTKQIATESTRLSHAVIAPILQVNSKIIMLLVLFIAVFVKNPLGAMLAIGIFILLYFSIYSFSKNLLLFNGNRVTVIMAERFKLLSDGFGVIKEIILSNRQEKFVKDFENNGEDLAQAQAQNQSISLIPKYIIEFFAYSGVILYSIYIFKFEVVETERILSDLVVYMFLGFKILPNIQQLYGNLSIVKGNISSFHAISKDINDSKYIDSTYDSINISHNGVFFQSVKFENVSYCYPNKELWAIKDLNIKFEKNKIYGIVGQSGAGKSTLIDLLLGLINPQEGVIKLNNNIGTSQNYDWQNKVGLVPQDVRLVDGTLIDNIALGYKEEDVDYKRIENAVKLANLNDIIDRLENGLNTNVGERGLNLSGGQKQRISIARALYNDPEILIFDEATSALDGISEKKIMDSIINISKSKTVVMIAHRLKTVVNCDLIYMLEDGRLIDQGSFEVLKAKNDKFKKMVENA